ncbi:hypothetical protein A9Q74_14520 [Colwellia sp. 39_35_sub15_T18]|nr:hypothetical protein A9Q74_14520 [Colwellia sp. 39_35_sub15_T18]
MKYNWQHPNWPKFIYNSSESDPIIQRYQQQAYSLLGRLAQLNLEFQQEAHILLIVEEAINSSEIEGENLNREEVRSSVARFLGLNVGSSSTPHLKEEGIAALLINVRESLSQQLNKEKLCYWHKLLLQEDENSRKPILKGEYRNETVDVIKDDLYGNIEVVFKAPGTSREEVTKEMEQFFDWYNFTSNKNASKLSGPVRAAIAHLWFVSIHPFEDGNGRIGRAIAEHALYQDFESPPLFSLSATINSNRKQYYQELQSTNKTLNISSWINWFVNIVHDSQVSATKKVDFILEKSKFWDRHHQTTLNERQKKALLRMFASGPEGFITDGISNEKYRAITGCSLATATRDLKSFIEKGVLTVEGSGKRNIRYLIKLVENNVFKSTNLLSQKGSRDKFIEETLEKLLHNIQRNVDFYQDQFNPKLIELIEHYQQLAEGNSDALAKLKKYINR